MVEAEPWHEDDTFWEGFAPSIFSERRLSFTATEVDSILALLGIEPGARVLDLCCGVGRHSLELALRGFQVTGVDRTRAYLDRAAQQATEEGLDVEFVLEDMRIFCRPDSFEAAISMYTSFGYFENLDEERKVVKNVCQSLKAGGVFLIEMMGKEVLAGRFQERDWFEEDGVIRLEERKITGNWGWTEGRWIMLRGNERVEGNISVRLYSATEIVSLLKECGFCQVHVYGGFDRSPYDHTARRLVTVARK